MSIVKNNFFKNELYIAHATPTVSDGVKDVDGKLKAFIDNYEIEALVKCLGIVLATEFFENLNENNEDMIKDNADVKWGYLLNGHTYTNADGDTKIWRGIRYSSQSLGGKKSDDYDKSFLANYIYYFYQQNKHIVISDAGAVVPESANSERVIPSIKVVKAWNDFVREVQGDCEKHRHFFKGGRFGGYGVDYYNGSDNGWVSLYQFIEEMNALDPDTYSGFSPYKWFEINEFGI